jgi:hypothetical protein
MRSLMRAGYLFALVTLASCAGDSSSTTSSSKSSKQSAVSAAQPAQSITLTTDGAGLVKKATAKGVTMHLEDRFQSAVIVRRNADGSLTTECHNEQHEAEAFVQGAATTTSGVK